MVLEILDEMQQEARGQQRRRGRSSSGCAPDALNRQEPGDRRAFPRLVMGHIWRPINGVAVDPQLKVELHYLSL